MVLDASLLNTQHYKVRSKGKVLNPGKGVAPSIHLGVVAIEKGTLRSTMVTNLLFKLLSNITVRLEFEPAYFEATVQHFSHNTT